MSKWHNEAGRTYSDTVVYIGVDTFLGAQVLDELSFVFINLLLMRYDSIAVCVAIFVEAVA